MKISTEEFEKIVAKIEEMYGDNGVYNSDHHPKLFASQIKRAQWALEVEKQDAGSPDNIAV